MGEQADGGIRKTLVVQQWVAVKYRKNVLHGESVYLGGCLIIQKKKINEQSSRVDMCSLNMSSNYWNNSPHNTIKRTLRKKMHPENGVVGEIRVERSEARISIN